MPILTLAAKDLRLLLRDARSAVILLVTPLLLILVLGLSLGEGFGEKPDERLRISVVNLDAGLKTRQRFPRSRGRRWSSTTSSATQDIRLEIIADRAEAEKLVARGKPASGAGLRAGLLRPDEPLLVPLERQPAADQPAGPRRRAHDRTRR